MQRRSWIQALCLGIGFGLVGRARAAAKLAKRPERCNKINA